MKLVRKAPFIKLKSRDRTLILEEDLALLDKRIMEIEERVKKMGPEFHEAFNQSSETWHDNAVFENARDRQDLLESELQELWHVRQRAKVVKPKKSDKVQVGSKVTLEYNGKSQKLYVVGDWSDRIGQKLGGYTIASKKAPLVAATLGKKAGDMISFQEKTITIKEIQ